VTSASAPCSDDRVALARRGTLSPAEWRDFATHLSTCADCRIAWRLAVDFDHTAAARSGDELVVARAVKAALASPARRRPGVLRFALAAGLVLVAGAASATIVLHARRSQPTELASAPESPKPAKPRVRSAWVRALPAVEALAPPVELSTESPPPPSVAPVPSAAVGPATSQGPRPVGAPAVPQEPTALDPFERPGKPLAPPSTVSVARAATNLFDRALAERQAGRTPAAIASFRTLQRDFADSPEATVALVSLGDLLLEIRLPAEALTYFQAYLHRAPSGTLSPEAWIGKARALDALGRPSEASAAWNEIARRFPDARYGRRRAVRRAGTIDPILPPAGTSRAP